jgi:predicted acyltransferase (DUF342 family)
MEFVITKNLNAISDTSVNFELVTILTTAKDVFILERNLQVQDRFGKLENFERHLNEEFNADITISYFKPTIINKDNSVTYNLLVSIHTDFIITTEYCKKVIEKVIKYLNTYE